MSSSAVTEGIRVSVVSQFIPERSQPAKHEFAFAYTVTIANEGTHPARLVSRHWKITDNLGVVREVEGEGVVGKQPHLRPGESFRYTSWCLLPTASGTMKGQYHMVRPSGETFSAEIAPFRLGVAQLLN